MYHYFMETPHGRKASGAEFSRMPGYMDHEAHWAVGHQKFLSVADSESHCGGLVNTQQTHHENKASPKPGILSDFRIRALENLLPGSRASFLTFPRTPRPDLLVVLSLLPGLGVWDLGIYNGAY